MWRATCDALPLTNPALGANGCCGQNTATTHPSTPPSRSLHSKSSMAETQGHHSLQSTQVACKRLGYISTGEKRDQTLSQLREQLGHVQSTLKANKGHGRFHTMSNIWEVTSQILQPIEGAATGRNRGLLV